MLLRVELLQHLLAFDPDTLLGQGEATFSLADFSLPRRCREIRDRCAPCSPPLSLRAQADRRGSRLARRARRAAHWRRGGACLGCLGALAAPDGALQRRQGEVLQDSLTRTPHLSPRKAYFQPAPPLQEDVGALLERIILVLESGAPPEPVVLRSRYHELRKLIASQAPQSSRYAPSAPVHPPPAASTSPPTFAR